MYQTWEIAVTSTVPNVEGLIPLDQLAIQFFIRTQEVAEILKEAGVHIVYLSVSRKQVALADKSAAMAAIATRFLPSERNASGRASAGLADRLSAQETELNDLKQKVERLLAQKTGGAAA